MFFKRGAQSEQARLYKKLRQADAGKLAKGVSAGGEARYVAYSRGCGGGASFLIREEAPDGGCRAWVVLATYEANGVEDSSFPSAAEAMRFASRAVDALERA